MHMHRSRPLQVAVLVEIAIFIVDLIRGTIPPPSWLWFISARVIVGWLCYHALHFWRARWLYVQLWRFLWVMAPWGHPAKRQKAVSVMKGHMKSTDIFVATPEKSGTTWLQHMAHQLRANGAEPTFEDQNDVMPYMEVHHTWYNESPTDVKQPYEPRIFKSHMTLEEMQQAGLAPPWADKEHTKLVATPPKGTGASLQYGRIIFCWRARDAALYSWYRFIPTFTHVHPDWIPYDAFSGTWLRYFLFIEKNRLQSLVDFWRLRHHPLISFNFYEDLVADHKGSLVRLAKWMNATNPLEPIYNDDLIERVRQQTTHTAMSSDEHISRFSEIRARQQCDIHMKKVMHTRLSADELKEGGKVRRTGAHSADADHQRLLASITKRLQKTWTEIVTPATGFATLDDMRRQWHTELAERGTPLNIQLKSK